MSAESVTTPLVKVRNLRKVYSSGNGSFRQSGNDIVAIDNLSFSIRQGETLALVGESGCGKTTTGRALLRLIEPTAGSVRFDGREITALSSGELRSLRKEMQMIFQDPGGSLNPRLTVRSVLREALHTHRVVEDAQLDERIAHLLETVGLSPDHAARYPHQFSAGQRQRIGIARALSVEPRFIVCDEPISALDVSIQAQILNLLRDLQSTYGLTYLFIAHDLNVVKHVSDRVAVMYRGRLMEIGPTDRIYTSPLHPYTRMLLAAVPEPGSDARHQRRPVPNFSPRKTNTDGCVFEPRCPMARQDCKLTPQHLRELRTGHRVACQYAEEDLTQSAEA